MKKYKLFIIKMLILGSFSNAFSQVTIINSNPIYLRASSTTSTLTKVLPPQDFIANPNKKSAFIFVTYTGFDAYPQAQAAFQHAVDILSTQIQSTVVIEVNAIFQPNSDPNILGGSRPLSFTRDFLGAPIPNYFQNTFYPSAIANKLAKYDLDPTRKDMELTFNSNNPNFYFGIDGNTPSGKFDFVTVVLHELIHGIGFYSGANVTATGVGTFGLPLPVVYDRLTQNTSGQLTSSLTEGSTALGTFLKTNNLVFNGWNANSYNNNVNPKLYAPSIWNPGTSYVHWDETYFPKGNDNSLMTPFLQKAESNHNPGNVTKGLLMDMGWDANFSTGIEDYVYLQTPITTLTQGSNLQYSGVFEDEPPYTTPITWSWELVLYHSSGTYVHRSAVLTQANFSNTWSFNMGYLPFGYNWQRDYFGNVLGYLKLKCQDSDGSYHYTQVQIGVKEAPDKPIIQLTTNDYRSTSFTFYSKGATSYKIFYDTDAGHPYNGIQAVQGVSGFSYIPSSVYSVTLNNLTPNINYYITVKGINQAGESMYATEIIGRPTAGNSDPGGPGPQDRILKSNADNYEPVYPNPANDYLRLSNVIGGSINIFNFEGKLVKSINLEQTQFVENDFQIDISELQSGIYYISYFKEIEKLCHEKIVILK